MKIRTSILILAIAVAAIPSSLIAYVTYDCSRKYDAVKQSMQPQLDEFGKIALLGEKPPQETDIDRLGDCIDSKPGVGAGKVYRQKMAGSSAVDKIREGLSTAGYTISREDFGSEGCKLLYRVTADNARVKVSVTAFYKDTKDPTCTDGYPKGIPESHFRSQDIDTIELRLVV